MPQTDYRAEHQATIDWIDHGHGVPLNLRPASLGHRAYPAELLAFFGYLPHDEQSGFEQDQIIEGGLMPIFSCVRVNAAQVASRLAFIHGQYRRSRREVRCRSRPA